MEEPLTPSHLLIGRRVLSLPNIMSCDGDHDDTEMLIHVPEQANEIPQPDTRSLLEEMEIWIPTGIRVSSLQRCRKQGGEWADFVWRYRIGTRWEAAKRILEIDKSRNDTEWKWWPGEKCTCAGTLKWYKVKTSETTIKAFVPIWSQVWLTRLILKWLIAQLRLQTPKDDQQEQPPVLLRDGIKACFQVSDSDLD